VTRRSVPWAKVFTSAALARQTAAYRQVLRRQNINTETTKNAVSCH